MEMLKRNLISMLFILGAMSIQPANAGGYLMPLGTGVLIDKIHVHSGGGVTIWVNAAGISNPDTCDQTNKIHFRKDDANHDTMVSVLLSAYMAKQKVGIWSVGCQIIPFWGGTTTYPRGYELWITD